MNNACSAAFKEWAVVIQAMEMGSQTILLRKGGISEDEDTFRIEHPTFLLFPTFEHQDARLLQPASRALLADTLHHPDPRARIPLTSFAKVEAIHQVQDEHAVRQLKDLFIWNDRYVEGRFRFAPEKPLYLLLLRVYRLPAPQWLDHQTSFGGCRSWIELEEPVSLSGSHPVIPEERFAAIRRDFERRTQGVGHPVRSTLIDNPAPHR